MRRCPRSLLTCKQAALSPSKPNQGLGRGPVYIGEGVPPAASSASSRAPARTLAATRKPACGRCEVLRAVLPRQARSLARARDDGARWVAAASTLKIVEILPPALRRANGSDGAMLTFAKIFAEFSAETRLRRVSRSPRTDRR